MAKLEKGSRYLVEAVKLLELNYDDYPENVAKQLYDATRTLEETRDTLNARPVWKLLVSVRRINYYKENSKRLEKRIATVTAQIKSDKLYQKRYGTPPPARSPSSEDPAEPRSPSSEDTTEPRSPSSEDTAEPQMDFAYPELRETLNNATNVIEKNGGNLRDSVVFISNGYFQNNSSSATLATASNTFDSTSYTLRNSNIFRGDLMDKMLTLEQSRAELVKMGLQIPPGYKQLFVQGVTSLHQIVM